MVTTAITPDQDAVVAEIFIAAPPERVFQAMTDPSETSQWWGQTGMYRITERKADSAWAGNIRASAWERTARRFEWTANTWKSIRRACWFTPGSRAGVGRSRPWFAGSLNPEASMGYFIADRKRWGRARW